ncbi:MFS transporter [Streptomyces sp. AK08-02]|uniref:MFS transporter n=1 Tax=Streptomyces sp. AK08-02 TaxID=3028654 RepID=UPI0029BA32B5|nr:MFS transporter [Streptomyces sp. AK08-02]MDX3752181.1 MFS transporter [Streptomyces sp. AK08-02]
MARSNGPAGPHVTYDGRYRPLSHRGLAAASIGHSMEWFDWNSYVIFSVFFAPHFFPAGNSDTAQLKTLMIFAIGFLFRPLGGMLLGGLADRHGRRSALTLSMLLMAGGSLLIAICPTYNQVGLLAPTLLLVARMAQGLSTGGEMAASATYLAEVAPSGRRGFYSSFSYVTGTLGSLAATLLGQLILARLGETAMGDWGWRIPFAFGSVIGLCALYLRRTLEETGPYLMGQDLRVRRPTWEVLRRHPASGLRVIGFTAGATTVYYTFLVYLPGYAQNTYDVPAGSALWVSVVAQTAMVATLPLLGILSDRIGRKPLLSVFAGGYLVLIVPLFSLLSSSVWSLLAVMTTGLLLFGCYAAIAPTAMAELFPTQVRSVGLGMPYSLVVAIFGGTAPYLVQELTERGRAHWFPWYVAALCLVSLLVYLTTPETKDVNLDR